MNERREMLKRRLMLNQQLLKLKRQKEKINRIYLPLLENNSRFIILIGGGGSGKSVFASQKIIMRYSRESGRKCVVVRKVADTLRDSCFAELKNSIQLLGLEDEWDVPKGRSSDLYLRCNTTGSEILFRGTDDIEKVKSIQGITDIWVEEASEVEESDINQLDIRMRHKTPTYEQMIITFNPVSITSYLKTKYFDRFIPNLETGKIYTYIFSEFEGIIQKASVLHTTYRHNEFLSVQQKATLEGFKDSDPYYYDVYCLGNWGVIGKTVFDSQIVSKRIMELRHKYNGRRGKLYRDEFGNVTFHLDNNGLYTIYKEPKKRVNYVIGADVAEGNEWGDYDAAHVMDVDTKEQVAVFHGHIDLDKYAEELEMLGHFYNNAMLCPEANFNPGLILNLERRYYPRMYMRQVTDGINKRLKDKFGWRTDKYNRQGMITDLVEFVRDYCYLINDIKTLEEMLTFVRDEKGKPAAQEGKHDDLVMSLAITLQVLISGQMGINLQEKEIDVSKLPETMKEDYLKADKYTQKYLQRKWGLCKNDLEEDWDDI